MGTQSPLSLGELEQYLKHLIRFGTIEFKVYRKDCGHRIEVYEEDHYECLDDLGNPTGEIGGDRILRYSLTTDESGKIGVIDHTHKVITSANKTDIVYLCDLVGCTVRIPSDVILDATPIDTPFERELKQLKKHLRND